jgi:hypothetical protein
VLSRHSYNEFGKGKGDGQSEDSMVDPEAIFSQLFGGERFQVRSTARAMFFPTRADLLN